MSDVLVSLYLNTSHHESEDYCSQAMDASAKEVSQQTYFRKTKRRLNSVTIKGLLMARLIDIDQ